jgi:hypothetical protein
MKTLLKFAMLLFAFPVMAQVSNPSIINVSSAPTGACTDGLPNRQVISTGVQYSCQDGTWGAFAAGETGTVESGTGGQFAYYPATGTAISGNPHLTDSGSLLSVTEPQEWTWGSSCVYFGAGTSPCFTSSLLALQFDANGLSMTSPIGTSGAFNIFAFDTQTDPGIFWYSDLAETNFMGGFQVAASAVPQAFERNATQIVGSTAGGDYQNFRYDPVSGLYMLNYRTNGATGDFEVRNSIAGGSNCNSTDCYGVAIDTFFQNGNVQFAGITGHGTAGVVAIDASGNISNSAAPTISAANMTSFPASVVTTVATQTLTNKTVDGVTPTTFGFVDPTSSIQTQLNSKQSSSVSNPISSATGGSGTGTVACATASCTNLRGSYTVAGGTFATGTLLTLVWPTTTTAYVCSGSVLNNATGASIGYHSVATATGMTFSSLTAATGLAIDVDYSCQP